MGWTNGRQLSNAAKGTTNLTYTYDANGLRRTKIVNDTAHVYVYENGQLFLEKYGTTMLEFLYTPEGQPYSIRRSDNGGSTWAAFYYLLNQQGDVLALMNGSGNIVARYTYDAWGKVTSVTDASGNAITSATHIANVNPIRYRGYYYDSETGLYYCQSRYYDPEVGRFINADGYISTGMGFIGWNMFACCNNAPTIYRDDVGYRPIASTTLQNEKPKERLEAFSFMRHIHSEEYKALTAGSFTTYKNIPVVRVPFGGSSGFSLGIIVLGNEVGSNISDAELLKHEYGHIVHMSQIGLESYLTTVLLPSALGYWVGVDYSEYYSLPWEYIADEFGGVKRTYNNEPYMYSSNADEIAKLYWYFTLLDSVFRRCS